MSQCRCKEYASLKSFNTLGLNAVARYFCSVTSEEEIPSLCHLAKKYGCPLIPLGGGSNVVLREEINALIMPVLIQHCYVTFGIAGQVFVTVGAGVNWHQLVRWTLQQGFYGLENLSLIPGNCGAAPVQNIGAYGVELKDVLLQVRGFSRRQQQFITLSAASCDFTYRDSVFKHALRHDFIITEITLCLHRTLSPRLEYGNLLEAVHKLSHGGELSGLMISDAVCGIRQSKLPDPARLGNAGSFFKNPVVSGICLQRIRKFSPDVVAYLAGSDRWKLAAGWLIEACGLKGYRDANVGTYDKQALVIVNYSHSDNDDSNKKKNVTGKDILSFARFIQQKVYERFQVHLDIEPVIYPDCCYENEESS